MSTFSKWNIYTGFFLKHLFPFWNSKKKLNNVFLSPYRRRILSRANAMLCLTFNSSAKSNTDMFLIIPLFSLLNLIKKFSATTKESVSCTALLRILSPIEFQWIFVFDTSHWSQWVQDESLYPSYTLQMHESHTMQPGKWGYQPELSGLKPALLCWSAHRKSHRRMQISPCPLLKRKALLNVSRCLSSRQTFPKCCYILISQTMFYNDCKTTSVGVLL